MAIDPYEKFVKGFRNEWYPDFVEKQKKVAALISKEIGKINSRGDACQIKHILDIGCGTGEILKFIKEYKDIDDESKNINTEYYGYDCSEYEINEALKSTKEGVHFKLVPQDVFFDIENLGDIDWSKTLLLCLGHTLPHFLQLDKFLGKIKDCRPKFIMFDFHETWDDVLEKCSHKLQFEPMDFYNGTTRGLATMILPEDHGLVKRGIAEDKEDSNHCWPDYKVETLQLKKNSEDFIKEVENQSYYKYTSNTYRSGYGNMKCYLFVAIEENAKKANEVYADSIKGKLLPEIFSSKPVGLALLSFDFLLAMVPHPFDSYFTFVEYTQPTPEWPEIKPYGVQMLMIVDKNGGRQEEFPTAHGLYLNILSDVGGSLIRPFNGEKKVDKNFRDYEKTLIEKTKKYFNKIRCHNSSSDEDEREDGLFILPVYYGTIPLTFLICKPMACFSIFETHQDVFRSLLINLFSAIWKVIDLETIKDIVLRPIVDDYILKNKIKSEDHIRNQIHNLFKTVHTKPWKSWVLAIPSVKINELDQVKKLQETIYDSINECIKDALSDPIEVISKVFQDCDFFAGPNHETFNIDRLNQFYQILKCKEEYNIESSTVLPENTKGDKLLMKWLTTQLDMLSSKTASGDQKGKAFKKIKSMFCGSEENTTRLFRFSLRRLWCYIEIYFEGLLPKTETKKILGSGETESGPEALDYQTNIDNGNDPIKKLDSLLRVLRGEYIEKIVLLGKKDRDNYLFSVQINMKEVICHDSKGKHFKNLLKAINDLDGVARDNIDNFIQIIFSFSVNNRQYKTISMKLNKIIIEEERILLCE